MVQMAQLWWCRRVGTGSGSKLPAQQQAGGLLMRLLW